MKYSPLEKKIIRIAKLKNLSMVFIVVLILSIGSFIVYSYKPTEKTIEKEVFAQPKEQTIVIKEKNIEPYEQVVCDYNNVCDNDETSTTCPTDCKRNSKESMIVSFIALLAMALIIGLFAVEQKPKRGNK